MPQFKVPIFGKDLEWAEHALHDAGIEIAARPDRLWLGGVRRVLRLGRRMTARLDANDAQEAEGRVRDALPDDDYTVGQAEPLGD
jgi:hypothetical protein